MPKILEYEFIWVETEMEPVPYPLFEDFVLFDVRKQHVYPLTEIYLYFNAGFSYVAEKKRNATLLKRKTKPSYATGKILLAELEAKATLKNITEHYFYFRVENGKIEVYTLDEVDDILHWN